MIWLNRNIVAMWSQILDSLDSQNRVICLFMNSFIEVYSVLFSVFFPSSSSSTDSCLIYQPNSCLLLLPGFCLVFPLVLWISVPLSNLPNYSVVCLLPPWWMWGDFPDNSISLEFKQLYKHFCFFSVLTPASRSCPRIDKPVPRHFTATHHCSELQRHWKY